MFDNAQMVEIGGKEVKSIVLQNGGVLYEKEPLILCFKGTEFKKSYYNKPSIFFEGTNILIDWGDGIIEEYSSETGAIHVYDENIEHIIIISNITSLNGNFSSVSDNTNQTYGITKVIFPNNIREITNGAFSGALITDIFIPSNIKIIGNGVFAQCRNLKNIILSEGLTTIGNSPFALTSIENIIIPSTVTSMGTSVFGGTGQTLKSISFLWNSEETIIPYNSSTYTGISPDNYTFNIPEGTTQLYVDKGYPLEKLVEGATSITLTSDKDAVNAGEIATIVATLDSPAENTTIIFTIGEEEQTLVSIGSGFELSTLNGFDVTNLGYINLFSRADTQGRFIKILNLMGSTSIMAGKSASFNTYDIMYGYEKIHIDPNNIIVYEYTDSSRTQTKIVDVYSYFLDRNYISEIDLTEWDLMSGGSSDRMQGINNTGVYATTDSNGQAIMKYEGVGAGDVTITGTYLDKDVSDSIVINDTSVLYLTSNKESITIDETVILTTLLLPEKANETIYINKIINDENLVLELTSTMNGQDYTIKAKVIDEDDNGLENIRIKLFKEE